MNFYGILGIPRDADDETIRSAYRILARQYHPDRGAGSSADKFRQVNEAYEALINPGTRQSYDLTLRWPEPTATVRVQPMVRQFGPFPREDVGLFGRLPPQAPVFRMSPPFDDFFDRWFHGLFLRF
jgi:curved DNA-binding protein CbpA